MNIHARRDDIRQQLASRRRHLTPAMRISASHGLLRSLNQLPAFRNATRIAGYWARNGELPLNLAVAQLDARRQIFLLPTIKPNHSLRFVPWRSGEPVAPNRYGIPEPLSSQHNYPSNLDLVLLPLLAFDRHGHRLGYGGGYYDRSFAFLQHVTRPARPILIGIAYAFQETAAIPVHEHDISLDYVATERELLACRPDRI